MGRESDCMFRSSKTGHYYDYAEQLTRTRHKQPVERERERERMSDGERLYRLMAGTCINGISNSFKNKIRPAAPVCSYLKLSENGQVSRTTGATAAIKGEDGASASSR